MKIILLSVGTRGDMEPFLAIGEILKEKGERVICAFPEQFRDLVENSNMEFVSLGKKFIELLESDDGKAALGGTGSGLRKIMAYIRLARHQNAINKELVSKQYDLIESEKPDRIVYNGKAIYPIIWGLKNRGHAILISPVPHLHYVKDHTHVAFNSNFGPVINKLTYSLANFGLITTVMITQRWLKLPGKIRRKQIKNALLSNKAIYTISPSLFPRPDYWNENIKILGYPRSNRASNWQPDNSLENFIKEHDRILFITFGSMSNPGPEKKTEIFINILERNKIPAIINTASGGLVKPVTYDNKLIYFVDHIPYDWILPKAYGIIHHGGSGTTHLGLRYGCATMIIPHIIDQFVWNKLISTMGAGPKGINIHKITTKNLEPKILELVNNASFKKEAERIGDQMEQEDFSEELYTSIVN